MTRGVALLGKRELEKAAFRNPVWRECQHTELGRGRTLPTHFVGHTTPNCGSEIRSGLALAGPAS